MDDAALLAAFAGDKSEAAFQELVRRHVGMVYSVCRRQLRDAHWAEDVTQAVFILLARKGASLPSGVVLGGWLYRTAMYACSNARNLKRTRTYHENLVTPMKITTEPDPVERAEMEGLLDEGLMDLSKGQREVLVLRFFENKPLTEIARMRGQSLYATQKALDSGMARMRRFLAHKGVAVSAAVIAAALLEQTARAIPVGLAKTVGTAALGSSPIISAHVEQLVRQLIRHATRAKLMGSLATAGVFVLLGVAGLGVGATLTGSANPRAAPSVVATESLTPGQQAKELDALWKTLRQAETALRKMDAAALRESVAFGDPQQAENWQVMSRVFEADLMLKHAASQKFGRAAQGLTAITTFAQRLDEVLPTIDPASAHWDIQARQATLHFGYRDARIAGGSLFFVKTDGQWRVDAGRSVDVVLEGLNGNLARAAMQDLDASQQALVLDKMERLRQVLVKTAQDIDGGQLTDIAQVQGALQAADTQSPGRAFFRFALRFDGGEQVRN